MAIDKITTPAVTDDSVTLAKMAPGTDGNIISYDASGNPVAVATGTDGQVLTSTGAGSPPAFEDAGGTYVLLGTTNVTSAASSTSFTSNINSTYKNYLFTYTDVRPSSDDVTFNTRFYSSIGSPDTGGSQYRYVNEYIRDNGDEVKAVSTGSSLIRLTDMSVGNASSELCSGQFILHNPAGTNGRKLMNGTAVAMQGDEAVMAGYFGAAYTETSVAITGVQFLFSSGNIAKGIFKFYGIN
tara:strand:- start:173 stop:892 length:720 start_codon:yes stop_codon:yes gene_type:complete